MILSWVFFGRYVIGRDSEQVMKNEHRRGEWKRNTDLERLLDDLNLALSNVSTPETEPKSPDVAFIVGSPRSGTTLTMQMLAASECFAYPSNFISRFWQAPHIGQMIQMMIVDDRFSFRDELSDILSAVAPVAFNSFAGKTAGALQPNEFWYFWRRFFQFDDAVPIRDKAEFTRNAQAFRRDLALLSDVAGRPLAMKGMIANWYLREIADILDRGTFVYIRRDPVDVMRSILKVRLRYFGDERRWYSFQTPLSPDLAELDPERQVAFQVAAHDVLIPWQLEQVETSRHVTLQYEDLAKNPALLRDALMTTTLAGDSIAEWEFGWKDQVQSNAATQDDADHPAERLLEKYQEAMSALDAATIFREWTARHD